MNIQKIKRWFYTTTSILAFVTLTIIFYKYSEPYRITYNPTLSYISAVAYNQNENFIAIDPIKDSINGFKVVQKQKIEAKERQGKIDRIEALFQRYNSPMQGYGELIFNKVEECGPSADYRIIIAIAGNESGLGRIPYKLYNPFGYLDGKQYADWNDSLSFLPCVITQRFLVPCNNDLVCIINRYAGPSDDKNQWIRNVTWFINQL